MKNVAIIGSTGSIGTQTLEIVRVQEDLNIVALAAGSNIELLEKQAREFSPEVVGIWSEENAARLRECLADTDIRVVAGMDGLIEIAELSSSDILVTAIVGMIGIRPTIAAINAGKDIALANKETLVTAGHIIMPLAAEKNVAILPVDSEHSAIFQSMQGMPNKKAIKKNKKQKRKILITTNAIRIMEAPPRFELGHKAFAELCLTTWLWCHIAKGFK